MIVADSQLFYPPVMIPLILGYTFDSVHGDIKKRLAHGALFVGSHRWFKNTILSRNIRLY